jgi:hypothetical protein
MLREGVRLPASVAGDELRKQGRSGATGGRGHSRGGSRTRASTKAAGLGVVAALALIAAGCGSSSSNTATTGATASGTPAATAIATTTAASTAPASESGLSGQWKGQYGGAYNGTFVLHWQQSGSSLSGKITISAPASTLDVNGTLHGSSITFGTVGSLAITYTGTVSGSSMSGSYHTPGGGGGWSASKS